MRGILDSSPSEMGDKISSSERVSEDPDFVSDLVENCLAIVKLIDRLGFYVEENITIGNTLNIIMEKDRDGVSCTFEYFPDGNKQSIRRQRDNEEIVLSKLGRENLRKGP
jgi:YD repeat-containing protein